MRGPLRSLVPLLALLATIFAVPLVTNAQPNVTGQWSTLPYLSPVSPIHVAVLNTGKVLMIEGSSNDPNQPTYRYAIWDPVASAFTTVGTTAWDLFCTSMAFLPDGRLLISGGNLGFDPFRGLKTTTVFDPATEKVVQVEDMAKGRWYPARSGTRRGDSLFPSRFSRRSGRRSSGTRRPSRGGPGRPRRSRPGRRARPRTAGPPA